MASLPVRDPAGDHLLTPHNAALAVIDYQPSQFSRRNRMTAATVADPTAREFLRNADPVLARVIDAHPDFRPRAWIDELSGLDSFRRRSRTRTAIVVTAVPRTGRVDHRTVPVSVPICQ